LHPQRRYPPHIADKAGEASLHQHDSDTDQPPRNRRHREAPAMNTNECDAGIMPPSIACVLDPNRPPNPVTSRKCEDIFLSASSIPWPLPRPEHPIRADSPVNRLRPPSPRDKRVIVATL
jgi:hypothetical protein